jgi:hypothetical protein
MADDPIDVVLEALDAQAKEIHKLHGTVAALGLLCTALAEHVKLTDDPDATIERMKNTFLFSRLPDAQVEVASKALELFLKPPRRNL